MRGIPVLVAVVAAAFFTSVAAAAVSLGLLLRIRSRGIAVREM